jgi:hypothetical protein
MMPRLLEVEVKVLKRNYKSSITRYVLSFKDTIYFEEEEKYMIVHLGEGSHLTSLVLDP